MPQAIQNVIDIAGPEWALALIGAAIAIVCDAAKPRRQPGEDEPRTLINTLAAICSLATPFLLIMHAVWRGMQTQQPNALMMGAGLVFAVVIGASLVGLAIGATLKPLGRALSTLAPWLAIAVFALTAYVCWQSAATVIQLYVLQNFTR